MLGGRWLMAVAMLGLLGGVGCCRWCERECGSTACAPPPNGCGQPGYVAAQPTQIAQPIGGAPVTMTNCTCTCQPQGAVYPR
jgi:hypothetical protein